MPRIVVAALALNLLAMPDAFGQTQATEAAGVRFEQTVQVGGKTLVLNGAGIRYRAFFRAAAVALYLANKADTAEAAFAAPGPKRIHLTMLRSVDATTVGKILSGGIEANATRQEFIAVLPGIARIGEVAAQMKTMSPGDSIIIDWAPDAGGVTFWMNARQIAGPYADFAAFRGIAKIWLGNAAADAHLKEALLGRSKEALDAREAGQHR